MSPKKGVMHAMLLPKLDGNRVPSDKEIADLLDDEPPVSMWHMYFDGCNTSDDATREN
jgi:hypothetical protein